MHRLATPSLWAAAMLTAPMVLVFCMADADSATFLVISNPHGLVQGNVSMPYGGNFSHLYNYYNGLKQRNENSFMSIVGNQYYNTPFQVQNQSLLLLELLYHLNATSFHFSVEDLDGTDIVAQLRATPRFYAAYINTNLLDTAGSTVFNTHRLLSNNTVLLTQFTRQGAILDEYHAEDYSIAFNRVMAGVDDTQLDVIYMSFDVSADDTNMIYFVSDVSNNYPNKSIVVAAAGNTLVRRSSRNAFFLQSTPMLSTIAQVSYNASSGIFTECSFTDFQTYYEVEELQIGNYTNREEIVIIPKGFYSIINVTLTNLSLQYHNYDLFARVILDTMQSEAGMTVATTVGYNKFALSTDEEQPTNLYTFIREQLFDGDTGAIIQKDMVIPLDHGELSYGVALQFARPGTTVYWLNGISSTQRNCLLANQSISYAVIHPSNGSRYGFVGSDAVALFANCSVRNYTIHDMELQDMFLQHLQQYMRPAGVPLVVQQEETNVVFWSGVAMAVVLAVLCYAALIVIYSSREWARDKDRKLLERCQRSAKKDLPPIFKTLESQKGPNIVLADNQWVMAD